MSAEFTNRGRAEGVFWHTRDDEPEVYAGDRILCVIPCRMDSLDALGPRLFVLTATETGWDSDDGWSFDECELWAHESDVIASLDPLKGLALAEGRTGPTH